MFGRRVALVAKRKAIEALIAEWVADVGDYDRSYEWQTDGFASASAAIRHGCHMDSGVAHSYVALARKLEHLPEVAAAFATGEISERHASMIARAHNPERAAPLGEVEHELVKIARSFSPRELGMAVKHLTDMIDGDDGAGSDDTIAARRFHSQSRTLDGMMAYNGLCDPETAENLEAVLRAELDRDHRPGEVRTPAHRRADAFSNMISQLRDHDTVISARTGRRNIVTVVNIDHYETEHPDLVAWIRAEGRRNGHLSAITLERMMCDCRITRVVTTGDSEILDVGRATRTIPWPIWKALVVRDQHCQAPGCDQPPERCEGHHLWHWEHGGPTSLENLKLFCKHHHHEEHRHAAQARAG